MLKIGYLLSRKKADGSEPDADEEDEDNTPEENVAPATDQDLNDMLGLD